MHVNGINDRENLEWIAGLKPDLICCFGWSQLLSPGILRISPSGIASQQRSPPDHLGIGSWIDRHGINFPF
jgi:ABC-type Fe3+-hydroxamate transport system substrate-binding protein